MKYIVYKTTCLINNKIYIGVHQTETPETFDGYLGRGFYLHNHSYLRNPIAVFHHAIAKYGVENFIRETLFVFDTKDEAYKKETEIVDLDFIHREDTYNVSLGGEIRCKIAKPVYQFDFNGKLLASYDSALQASKLLEVSPDNIREAVRFKRSGYNSLWCNEPIIQDISEYSIKINNKYYIYDSSGVFITEFENLKACCEFLSSNTGNISRAIKTNLKVKGYFISTEKVDKLQIVVTKLSGKLNRYSESGHYIDSFNTVKEAKDKLGLKLLNISSSIKLNRTCNGFRWTRGDNPTDTIDIVTNSRRPIKKIL
jgi:hypothetical protein